MLLDLGERDKADHHGHKWNRTVLDRWLNNNVAVVYREEFVRSLCPRGIQSRAPGLTGIGDFA